MKRIIMLLWCFLFVGGCGPMKGIEASFNRSRLNRLELGMTQDTVKKVMGKPYIREAYELKEVWLYITAWQADGYTTSDEMTPLVFENGILIGWGSRFIDENIRKYEFRIR